MKKIKSIKMSLIIISLIVTTNLIKTISAAESTTPISSGTTLSPVTSTATAKSNPTNQINPNMYGSFSMPTPNFIPFNDYTLQQMFLNGISGQMLPQPSAQISQQQQPSGQMTPAAANQIEQFKNIQHGQMSAASEDSFPGFGFGTHDATDMASVVDPGFQSVMGSLNPMASMAEGLEFMKPSFESAAALHSSELNSNPFGIQNARANDGVGASQSMVARSGLYPPIAGQMAPVFTPDRPPKRRHRPRSSAGKPAETRTYHSEFEYSAPRREKSSYGRRPRPPTGQQSSSYDGDSSDRVPPPPPSSSYDKQPSSDTYGGSPKYEGSSVSYGGNPRSSKRRPKDSSEVKRYNSRESEFYDSDSFDGPDSSEDAPVNPTPKFNRGPSSPSYGGPSNNYGQEKNSMTIPHPPTASESYRGPSRNKPKNLKEGETYVEGYEWKGDPIPMRGGSSAAKMNDEEARKRQEESSYSYTHVQKSPKDKSSKFVGRTHASDNGDEDEETRKQELRTTYDSPVPKFEDQKFDQGQRSDMMSGGQRSPPSSSSYSSLSDLPKLASPNDQISAYKTQSFGFPPSNSNSDRIEGPMLKNTPMGTRNANEQSASDRDTDKIDVEEDNSDVIPPGYEEVKF